VNIYRRMIQADKSKGLACLRKQGGHSNCGPENELGKVVGSQILHHPMGPDEDKGGLKAEK
jgi:hypothetical protein